MSKQLTQDQIIILRKFPINESDQLLVVFGKQLGKILIKVKGEKKIKSQFKGKINIFNLLNASIYDSGRSYTMTEAHLTQAGPDGSNLLNFQTSQHISKLLNQLLQDKHQNQQIFHLLSNCIQALSNPENQPNIFQSFIIKYLYLEGHISPIQPPKELPEGSTLYFYIDNQGSINSTISPKVETNQLIPAKIIKVINFFIKNPIQTCTRLKLSSEEQEFLDETIKSLFQNNLHLELKSYQTIT